MRVVWQRFWFDAEYREIAIVTVLIGFMLGWLTGCSRPHYAPTWGTPSDPKWESYDSPPMLEDEE